MTNNIFKVGLGLLAFAITFGACNKEPDESNLYTMTGETIGSFIKNDSNLTSFQYILERTGLDRNMATYGQYTCYAPTNAGVAQYIDSLWNDSESANHNGLVSNSLEGLSDSLCNDIALYHLTNGLYSIISMGGSGATITTMLSRPISSSVDSLGNTVLNGVSTIISEDNEVINGLVQIVDNVIPRTSRLLGATMQRLEDYSIFYEALLKTGLVDSVAKSSKGIVFNKPIDATDTDGSALYAPTECKVGYTIFAESNAVLKANGITSFDDLVAYANKVYGGATSWYDYPREKGIKISTGSDYTNRFNALNMFVAYHILFVSMAQDQMVFEDKPGVPAGTDKWNYVNGGEPYDYYETMLPNTLLKIWQPQPGRTLYINRWVLNNTLTDEVGTMGSAQMHPLKHPGIEIERKDITAYNGYIHPIKNMLVYDDHVPQGVLNERVRLDATTFLEELINNNFRYMYMDEISALNGGGSGARVAYPVNYFNDVICYNGESTKLRTNVRGDYRAYQADAFQGWGQYDLAIKIPSMPSGLYEFRLFYSPMGHGGMMQFYWGKSKNVQDMQALSIPLDVRILEDDPRIGWTAFYEEDDLGIATDETMHNRGYMRGPYSFCGHPGDDGDQTTTKNCRGDGVVTLRRVLGRINLKQSDDFWFRFKSVINDDFDFKWQLDFVEFVPVNIVDNERYSEDWY